MSSETSSIDLWTGRFLRWFEMSRPKTRPASDTRIPVARSDQPVRPRKETDRRSGRIRLASPPCPPSLAARVKDVSIAWRFMTGRFLYLAKARFCERIGARGAAAFGGGY